MSSVVSEIKSVGVVGLGLLGHGIAQAAAQTGNYKVIGIDSSDSMLDQAKNNIEGSVRKLNERLVVKKVMSAEEADGHLNRTMDNLSFSTDTRALEHVDLVIEAIVEDMDVKKKLFKELGTFVKPSGILASNTSSLRIGPMAEASGRPDRVVGLHYFNPVQLMKLVEFVSTDTTEKSIPETMRTFVENCGKTVVDCKDTPGFVVNRLLVPYIASAIAMAERKDASIPDIDIAMRLGASNPMGPLTLADYVGLDTTLNILKGWKKEYPDEPTFFVPKALELKVAKGKLGRKSGEGFYHWGDGTNSTKPTGFSGLEEE